MKNIVEYVAESCSSEFAKKTKACKTFGKFFCMYMGIDSLDDFSKDDFEMNDTGFLFNREDMSFEDFKKWLESTKDEKITNIKDGYHGSITFTVNNEKFDLDYVEED